MKKELTTENVKWIIVVFGVIVVANLFVVVGFPAGYEYVGLIDLNVSTDPEKAWAFRGQVGDILAGHFTAITMLFVVYSLLLQRKSVEQMGESITQQSEAINQQSTAIQQQSEALANQQEEIKLQTKALTAQIKEMEIQNIEFAVSNAQTRFKEHFLKLDNIINKFKFVNNSMPFYGVDAVPFYKARGSVGTETIDKIQSFILYCRLVSNEISELEDSLPIKSVLKSQFIFKFSEVEIVELYAIFIRSKIKKVGFGPFMKEEFDIDVNEPTDLTGPIITTYEDFYHERLSPKEFLRDMEPSIYKYVMVLK